MKNHGKTKNVHSEEIRQILFRLPRSTVSVSWYTVPFRLKLVSMVAVPQLINYVFYELIKDLIQKLCWL